MKNIVMYSGGKDSGATLAVMLEKGIKPDIALFSEVMFDNERGISGEAPEHIEWINHVAKPLIESWGIKFVTVRSKEDYITLFHKKIIRSKEHPERVGKLWGFPLAKGCYLKRDCKIRPMNRYLKSVSEPFTQWLGIAADEPQRFGTLGGGNKRSILTEKNITEAEAFDIAEKYGLLSPIYDKKTRGGCWFCPNSSISDFAQLKITHPELWRELAKLDEKKNRVSLCFRYDETFSEVNDKADRLIRMGLARQMSMWEYLRRRE